MTLPPRITAVSAVAVRVPRRAELLPKTAHGEVLESEYALIQITVADGVRGIGEATTAPGWNGEAGRDSADIVNGLLRSHLIGKTVDDWTGIAAAFDRLFTRRPFLRAAIEMACLDAHAKATGVRVVDLLGGQQQSFMESKIVLPARDTPSVERMVELALSRGAQRLKVKVGLDIRDDMERVAAVRALHAGPLSLDANEGWPPTAHETIVESAQRFDLTCIEQPFSREARDATRVLQEALQVPLLADESVWNEADVNDIADQKTFRAVSLYPGKVGGVRRFVRAVATARQRGLEVIVGSNLELGVGTAAMAHALAATPVRAQGIGHDLIGPLYFEHALVEDAGFVGYAGASLPEGTGLGVNVDHRALARFAATSVSSEELGTWR